MPRDKPSQGVTMLNPFLDETDSSDEEADANTNEPVKNKGYLVRISHHITPNGLRFFKCRRRVGKGNSG